MRLCQLPSRERSHVPPFMGSSENHRRKNGRLSGDMLVPNTIYLSKAHPTLSHHTKPPQRLVRTLVLLLRFVASPRAYNVRSEELAETN